MGTEGDDAGLGDLQLVASLERDVARETARARLFGGAPSTRTVSRFHLLERVGSGSMGTVYAAYDPELDRRLAIKLLDGRRTGPAAARRMVTEARAMARLAHPNVVAVYEVGVHEHTVAGDPVVYVAMQFIHGLTLRHWVEHRNPPWREIVHRYLAAGRGLAAVHAEGLVHRDFKPDNAMITDDGHVAVMDFGLALAETSLDTPVGPTTPVGPMANADAIVAAQQTDSISGTPAYMAPELFAGIPASERSDQFAFCVALFEALWGHRPFAGTTLGELVANLELGRMRRPEHMRGVPADVLRALVRGLDVDPRRRFASMHALLAAIERAAGRSRRRTLAWGAGGLGAVGLLAWAARPPATPACDPADAIARVWNDAARAQIHDALARAQAAGADDLEARIASGVDTWSQGWAAAFLEVCAARTRWDGALLDRAERCLDRRLDALGATIETIGRVDLARRSRSIDAVERLPPAAPCADPAALRSDVDPPGDRELADTVDTVRRELGVIEARRTAGDFDGSADDLAALVARAEAIDYSPVLAEVLLAQGNLLVALGSMDPAVASLERAFFTALAASHREVAIDAATTLVGARGAFGRDLPAALAWERHARALLATRATDPHREITLQLALADAHMVQNDLPETKARLEAAAAIIEEQRNDRAALEVHLELGFLALRTGDLDVAGAEFERSHALALELLGAHHPTTGNALVGLATVAQRRGDTDAALRLTRSAADVYAAALGPDHANVAGTMHNLGSLQVASRDYVGARATLEANLALRERILGPDHADIASSLGLLAVVYEELGEVDRARAANERALAIAVAVYGSEHPLVADLLNNLGTLAMQVHDMRGAIARFERAVPIRLASQGADHPDVGMLYRSLAECHLELGDLEPAERYAVDAVRIEAAALGEEHERAARGREVLAEVARRVALAAEE
ncbi:MAG: serine/threonine protein kinase [Myxococcales bacterium]|nr:serine/threonine protein kinase [Myxococcales bacterium]